MTTALATRFGLAALSRVGRIWMQLLTVASVGCAGESWLICADERFTVAVPPACDT
jgi:hypothetical protein